MVIAVPPANVARVSRITANLDVAMTVLGEFTGDGVLHILHNSDTVGELECGFLHNGIPRLTLEATWKPPTPGKSEFPWPSEATPTLLSLLADPNVRSKEDIVRRYDHEVQGGTVVKPFVGPTQSGPSDAAVVAPLAVHRRPGSTPGAALGVGVNPGYGALDPYLMAWAAVDEAIRNVIAVGADPARISILDNFSWGNPRLPDRLGALVRCTQGCHDAAVAYGTPFISGKDSLNNEYTGADGRKHTIPGTLVISALGIVPDISNTVTSDLKAAGNTIFVVGTTGLHLGGSVLARFVGYDGGSAPAPPIGASNGYLSLHQAISSGLVASCHDVSEGGIAVAAAEMAIGGGTGIEIHLGQAPRSDQVLDATAAGFSESLGRFLVEVRPEDESRFENVMAGYPVAAVGRVRPDEAITLFGLDGTASIATDVTTVGQAWRSHMEHGR
jgi:phosphoribosylformylglycinamidine synthase